MPKAFEAQEKKTVDSKYSIVVDSNTIAIR
jgi:hypothetical protein